MFVHQCRQYEKQNGRNWKHLSAPKAVVSLVSVTLGGRSPWNGLQAVGEGQRGRRGGGVALDVREQFDCRALRVGGDVVESLRVKIREVENKGDLVGVHLKEVFAC